MQLYTNSFFDGLRQRQDEPADRAVSSFVQFPEWIPMINSWEVIPSVFPNSFPQELKDYFSFYREKKDHCDLNILERGQRFFEQQGDLYLAMLGLYSLPYCYAFADGAQVLVRSKRILENIGERLGETSSFLMDIFQPGAFFQKEKAFLTCAKVRLIHSFSRYFVSTYATDWKEEFGRPVNQEDMIGTNLAFSFIVLRGLTKLGFQPSETEYQDVLAYWKWIGELMGIDVTFWPDTPKEAFELDRLIRRRQLKSSEAGRKLIDALIGFYKKSIPDPLINQQIESILCFFLGKEAAEALGLSTGQKLSGNVLGLIFSFLGWKNYGGNKGYTSIRQSLELQQMAQFGKVLNIRLPELHRT